MRIIFFGTPQFAVPSLDALMAAGHDVVAVVTQPDRYRDVGPDRQPGPPIRPPIKTRALTAGIPVLQPERPRGDEFLTQLRDLKADIGVVVAYGHLLRPDLLALLPLGFVNVHASLLPRWRGAAPIQRAIEAGDTETGVCIMQMDAGLDTGAVVSTHHYAIKNTDTATDVHDALAVLGAHAIVADLQQLQQTGGLNATPQPPAGITYAQKLSKEEAKIDWNESALVIERKIRAFNPVPGAWVEYQNQPLKIWRAEAVAQSGRAGEVLAISSDGLIVACGEGALNITELQPAGSKRMPVAAFAAGRHIEKGTPL